MKKHLIILMAFFSFVSMAKADESSHVRVLFHSQRAIKHDWGTAGWLIGGDITSNPSKWVIIYGPRYQQKSWWLEMLGGAVIEKGQKTWIADFRLSPPKLKPVISMWLNVRPYFPQAGQIWQFYWYYQIDYSLPCTIGKIGLEIENLHRQGKDNLSVGPHLIVPVGTNFKISTAYQWHRAFEGNQWWFRCLTDF